jgi:hypothetical protein
MSNVDVGIAVFNTHGEAENAVKELQTSGFDMKKLSIVGKDYHTEEQVVGYYHNGDRMMYWGKMGAFWGGIWGVLFGAAFFWVPGIGPLVVAGPLISAIVGGLEGAVAIGGLSALGAGLYGIGVPKDSIINYESSIKADKFLLVVHGSGDELTNARDILKNAGHDVTIHSSTD